MNQVKDQHIILVVDDSKRFREQEIPEALARLNAHVLLAKNVLEACLVAAEHDVHSERPLDLIVLDMHMPLYNEGSEKEENIAQDAGIQFLRSFGFTKCPVVVFTAYPSYEDCVRVINVGAAAYLPKQDQEVYKGRWEGGIDRLVEKCHALLENTSPSETRLPPDGRWLDQNYDWLCENFGGRWVAFVRTDVAPMAGIKGTEREGLVIVAEESKEKLARLIAGKHSSLKEIPVIALVPESEIQTE